MRDFLIIGNYFGIVISIIFFIIFFFTDKKLNKARSFVMIGMFLFAISFLFGALTIIGEKNSLKIIGVIYLPFLFILYPLIFHYIINLISNSEKIIIEKEKYILPLFILFITLAIHLFFEEAEIKKLIINDYLVFSSNIETYNFVLILFIIIYYLQAIYFIYQFFKFHKNTNIIETKINTQAYLHRWIKYITYGVIIVEFTYIIIYLFSYEAAKFDLVASCLLVIFFGIIGIKHNEILLNMRITNGFNKHKIEGLIKRKRPIHITKDEMKNILLSLDKIISSEKLYLDPNLKLKNLAKKIHTPEKELSILINDHFNKNFATYINDFRIAEAKNILEMDNDNCRLDNLYLQVGFFTRSTFNRVFKSTTNTTPTEYKKSISL